MKIIIDAYGGDNSPQEIVTGDFMNKKIIVVLALIGLCLLLAG